MFSVQRLQLLFPILVFDLPDVNFNFLGIGMGWSNCKHEMQNRNWKCTITRDLDNKTVTHECKGSSTGSFGSYGYSTFSGETKSSERKS